MRKIFYTLSVAMLMILFYMLGFAIAAAFAKFICWCFGLVFNISTGYLCGYCIDSVGDARWKE